MMQFAAWYTFSGSLAVCFCLGYVLGANHQQIEQDGDNSR